MATIRPDADKTPIKGGLTFVDGDVFVLNLSAEDFRQIDKQFPHYTAAAGPSKAGQIQDDQKEAYGDEVISRVVVDETGARLFPDRTKVAALGMRRHNEVDRAVAAILNGSDASDELVALRGLWRIAGDYLRDDQHGPSVALDFWTAAKAYVEDVRKNVPRLASGSS